jgi:hypothetical protein
MKLAAEIASWIGSQDLITLFRCVEVVINPHDVNQSSRVRQSDLRAHVPRDTPRRMEGDGVSDQIGASFGDAVTSEKSASGVSAVHLETLRVRMVRIDEPDVVRHGCDGAARSGRTIEIRLSSTSDLQLLNPRLVLIIFV